MSSKNLDAILVFPPPYVYTELQPGIAAVVGYAKKEGLKIKTIDANIDALEYLLKSVDKSKAEQSINIFKDKDSYLSKFFGLFKNAKDTIEKLSKEASKRNGEEFSLRRNTVKYVPKYDAQTRKGIIEALNDIESNIFYSYIKNELIPELKNLHSVSNYSLVGIGVTDRKQIFPAFIMSSLIKKEIPSTKTLLGGNFISRNRDILKKNDELNRKLFEHTDFLLYLESEAAFSDVIKALKSGEKINNIEKLIWLENGEIKSNELKNIFSLNDVPLPDYDGLKSWTPEPVPAYNFQRGCNYGKCDFCGLMDGYDSFSMRSTDNPTIFIPRRKATSKIISDLKELKNKGYNYINFTDETFFSRDQLLLSKRFEQEGINISWTSYDRVEKDFENSENCKIIRKGGSVFKQFGVESASVNSLENMTKGVDNQNVYSILRNTHEAGIMNHVFLIVGYPGETLEQALMLFPFLDETKEYTFTVKPTWYKLAQGSPDSFKTELKEIQRTYAEGDLAPNLHFQTTKGMSRKLSHSVNDLVQGWINRNHLINYVAGTYCYSQRFFSTYEGILDVVEKIKKGETERPSEFSPNYALSKTENQGLKMVWNELVGSDYVKVHKKYCEGNRNKMLVKAHEEILEKNTVARNYPDGFIGINDLVYVSKNLLDYIK